MLASPAALLAQPKPAGRILGVFDDATGRPIAGAKVIDLNTGTKAVTSETGTISLAWLGPGTTILQIRKIGFVSRMRAVSVSPADTVSITVVLTPLPQELPVVVSKARAPTDTVRRLELAGFYDRKRSSGAPTSAFVSAADMERWKLMYLGDVKARNGRGICGDIYVNGVAIVGGIWLGPGDAGSKLQLRVEEVAGIETYYGSEVPAQFNMTSPRRRAVASGRGGQGRCIATVIWLK